MSAERWEPQVGEFVEVVSVGRAGTIESRGHLEVTRRTPARVWVGDRMFRLYLGQWRCARAASRVLALRRATRPQEELRAEAEARARGIATHALWQRADGLLLGARKAGLDDRLRAVIALLEAP